MANYLIILLTFFSFKTHASSCCGGGANIPNIILGDHQWEAKLNYSNSAVTDMATSTGEFSSIKTKNEVTETVSLKVSYLLGSYFQLAIDIPFKKRTVEATTRTSKKQGLIDPSFQLSWEFLPELTYSPLKPRGFVFFKQLIPVGRSIYSYQDPLLSDSLSRGVYESTVGLALYKVISPYDFSYTLEIHHGFKRTIKSQEVYPGLGYSTSVGLGYSFGQKTRIGTAVTFWKDSSVEIEGTKGDSKYYLAGALNFSYMFINSSLLLSYSNQALFRVARNTNLAQSLTLEYKFFEFL